MSWRVDVRARFGKLALDARFESDGRPLALIGPNGSGKTSVLRLIAGVARPSDGVIEVEGELLYGSDRDVDLPSEHRRVGYVPQGFGLFPHLRVVDNVAFGLSFGKGRRSRGERRQAAIRMLEELECSHLAERLPGRLSAGEQQRVALARALILEPRLLLLDEPLAALDAIARRSVRTFLAERLRTLACPSVLVTHDVHDVQALDADICVLEGGRILQQGHEPALRRAPASEFVARFLGVEGGGRQPATPA